MNKILHKILLCCLVLLNGATQKIIASSSDLIINAKASLLAATNCLSNTSITKSYTDNQLANSIEKLGNLNNILTSHATTINDADIIVFLNNTNSLITALHTIATNNNASNTTILSTPNCILTIGTLLSNIAYNTNLASLNNCGHTVINLINLLDILAAHWSIPTASLNSTDSNVYNSLKNNNNADPTTWYITGSPGNWSYVPGKATTPWLQSITTLALNYIAQIISLKSLQEFAYASGEPYAINRGPNHTIWVTEWSPKGISSFNLNGSSNGRWTTDLYVEKIVLAPDNNLYGTTYSANKIAKITPTGTISYITIPSTITNSNGTIIMGPDNNLWYSSANAGKIGKINLSTNSITEYTVASPFGLAAGSDGHIWFTSTTSGNNRIGRITTDGTNVTYFNTGLTSNCFNTSNPLMTPDTQGNIWFLETAVHKIGKISASGIISEYTIPTANPNVQLGITLGPDNCIWFNQKNSNKIGRLNPNNGIFTEFTIPTANSGPGCVCIASNGSLWFTERAAGKIGTIKLMQ